jgi:hypothetical protein
MAPQLFGLFGVGIGAFASGEEAALAEVAFAAGDGEGDHDWSPTFKALLSAPTSTTSPIVS